MMTDPDLSYSVPLNSPNSDPEAELQKELQAMFEVDSQENLQSYFQLAQQLSPASWVADIQSIYRAIHTIKGSAVTVGADAVLQTAMVLEDLLSDLRYLEEAPPLSDGALSQILFETGELLGSCLQLSGPEAQNTVAPTVNRIKQLHEQVQAQYLPNWDEMTLVHQEFAEQGFDLVILDLEISINQLCDPHVPLPTLVTAEQVLAQLRQIGQDLQLAEDWFRLLDHATGLNQFPLADLWCQQWPMYFDLLKLCAKQSGQLTLNQQEMLTSLITTLPEEPIPSPTIDSALAPDPGSEMDTEISLDDWDPDFDIDSQDMAIDLSMEALALDLETMVPEGSTEIPVVDLSHEHEEHQATPFELSPLNDTAELTIDHTDDLSEIDNSAVDNIDDIAEEFLLDAGDMDYDSLIDIEFETASNLQEKGPQPFNLEDTVWVESPVTAPSITSPDTSLTAEPAAPSLPPDLLKPDIKIPVPLDRLNQSSQQVVETLLSARTAFNETSNLQNQLAQLTSLTKESAEYISRLRQLQDSYALLRDMSNAQTSGDDVSMERYREGYTTINRLLENILRMSELGAELEETSQQSLSHLEQLSHNISTLKDGIEASRLVPFSNLTLRARAILRDLTNRYDKPAVLEIKGEQVELDAGVVQQLEPALLHLLRNAYDHGIESTEERLQQKKPVQATIKMILERRGNFYRLLLQDDGQGINADQVSQIAQEKGFSLTQTQNPDDLVAVLCQPGFSSRSSVSEVSGRGVGMDVVASQIANIGGRLRLETQWGLGTTFIIEIPAPQLLVPCVLFKVGERTVALPTDDIQETMMADANQLLPPQEEGELSWQLSTERGTAPGYVLAAFWHESMPMSDTAICVRLRMDNSQGDIWLIADDLLGQEELLIQPLPHPLVSPPTLLGLSLQADGQLLSVLDPIELVKALAIRQPQSSTDEKNINRQSDDVHTILVVDDAALMRRRLESSLNTYGFATFTCRDGQEAWQWLQTNGAPDMMITDLEMPNMDGFTLIDRCRQANIEMPILVVSSRLAEEWGKEAERLGANDYLNKGFSTPELIDCVSTHLKGLPA